MNERAIFLEALGQPTPQARAEFLARTCAHDADLRRRLERLLDAHDEAGGFLERPAFDPVELGLHEPPGTAGGDPDLGFLDAPWRPGTLGRLGHYEVLEIVGRGGMGVVLRALDEKLRRVVAIKVMSPALAASALNRQRFIREARAAAAMAHEHVVPIYAVEENHQPPYLVMPFIEGISLQGKLDAAGCLGVREALRIGFQVAEGLAAAHKQGLVHRDVKPANILLENGVERVKLTDFGLARPVDDVGMTQSGLIVGTPLYMSPEQAEGQAVDHRSDLFSLGSVLYTVCTGRPPFRGETALSVLRRVTDSTPTPIRELNPETPAWLAAIVDRLLEKDPDRRFQSAREVADLLARQLARLQQPAPPPARGEPLALEADAWPSATRATVALLPEPVGSKPGQPRRRHQFAAAAGMLLLLGAGLGASEVAGLTDLRGCVIRLATPSGTLLVQVEDPNVSVSVDGRDVVITGAGVRELRLKSGQHQVTATRDGAVIQEEWVNITRDGRPVVKIGREGGLQPAVSAGPSALPAAPETSAPAPTLPDAVPYEPNAPEPVVAPAPRHPGSSTLRGSSMLPGPVPYEPNAPGSDLLPAPRHRGLLSPMGPAPVPVPEDAVMPPPRPVEPRASNPESMLSPGAPVHPPTHPRHDAEGPPPGVPARAALPKTAGPAPAPAPAPELEALLELAKENLERTQSLYKAGRAAWQELHAAEMQLAEARLRRARAAGDAGQQRELLSQIVSMKKDYVGMMNRLQERGVLPRSEILEAQKALLEARLRLREFEAAHPAPAGSPAPANAPAQAPESLPQSQPGPGARSSRDPRPAPESSPEAPVVAPGGAPAPESDADPAVPGAAPADAPAPPYQPITP